MKTHPPIDALITCETSKRPYRELFLARYHQQQWTAKKLFTIGIICRDSGLSPDKQWYYCASVNNGTFLGRVGQPKLKKISEELLNCRFSPDGRYLLGTEHFSGGIIVFAQQRHRACRRDQRELHGLYASGLQCDERDDYCLVRGRFAHGDPHGQPLSERVAPVVDD